MIRLIGFLVGSAVSIGMLLLILGIPDITLSREVIEQIDFDDVYAGQNIGTTWRNRDARESCCKPGLRAGTE